jgi:hypothetical protein
VDVTPAQSRVIEEHIRRLRALLLRTLDWQHMKPELPGIPVSRSVITDLGFIDIAVEELKPRHLRGCGPVPEDAMAGLNEVVKNLHSLVRNMNDSIREELAMNEESRSSQTHQTGEEE